MLCTLSVGAKRLAYAQSWVPSSFFGKSFNLSVPPFPNLKNGDEKILRISGKAGETLSTVVNLEVGLDE